MDAERFEPAWGSTRMPVAREEVKEEIDTDGWGTKYGVAEIKLARAMI